MEDEDSSDEDEPLASTKKRIMNEELRKKPTGAGGDGNDTAQLPSLQSSGISVNDADTPAKKRKVHTKADQLAEIAEREKKDKVLDQALSIIEGGGEFDPQIEYFCNSLILLLEKIDGEAHQHCMLQVQQLIVNHVYPPWKTAVCPGFEESAHGHALPEEDFPTHVRYVKVLMTETHSIIVPHVNNDDFDLNGLGQM